MALQSISPIIWPRHWASGTSLATSNIATLDAAGEYVAFVFVAREAMTISHVGTRSGTIAGSPTLDIRIETVDASTGLPTGTLWATNTNIVTAAWTSNLWRLEALTASASISYGQVFAVKLAFNSGTSFQVRSFTGMSGNAFTGHPYQVLNTGTPTKAAAEVGGLALGSSTSSFYSLPSVFPYENDEDTTFNNTGGARRGVKFTAPFTGRCIGLHYGGIATAVGDFNAGIWDDAGNEVNSSITAHEGDIGAANATRMILFDNPVTISAGTAYRAAIEPSSATNCQLSALILPSADYRSAMPGGTNFFLTTYTSGGGWVDTATEKVAALSLVFDQLDDGVGGGGGAPGHGNMTGGMQ